MYCVRPLRFIVNTGIGQVSHCQCSVGLKQGASEDIIVPRPPLHKFAAGQAEGLCQVWMELIKSFFTVSEGITMHHAHTSQWAEAFPPQLTVPRGMQVPIYGRIGLSRVICPADYYVSDVKLPTIHNVRDLGVLIDGHLTFRCLLYTSPSPRD